MKGLKKIPLLIVILVVLLIAARMALPSIIRDRINHTLQNSLTNYEGSIRDFDLRLIAGTYFIEDLQLRKKTAPPDQYLVKASKIEVDVSWKALFHRQVLLDAKLKDAAVELDDNKDPNKKQTGAEEKNWRKALDSIIPFDLQSLELENCTFRFKKKDQDPQVDVVVDRINGEIRDIGNLRRLRATEMPTTFFFMTRVQNHARFFVSGQGSFLTEPFSVVVNTDLQELKLTTLNDLFKAYGWFDITSGTLSVNGNSKVRWPSMDIDLFPQLKNVDVVAPKQDFKGARGLVTELGLALVNLIARAPADKTVETELRMKGNWPKLELDTWRAIKGLLEPRKTGKHYEKTSEKPQGV